MIEPSVVYFFSIVQKYALKSDQNILRINNVDETS